MDKKILLANILLATSSVTFAYSAPYVGASIGVTANTAVINSLQNYAHTSFRGMPVAVFLGYGAVLDSNFYIGGEITGTISTFDLTDNGLKSSYGYGASLLPGLMMCDHTLAYLRIGVVRARFPSQSESSTGGQIGLGIQSSLTQNVDLRGEYDFIAYRGMDATGYRAYAVTPRSDQFILAAVYKFD